MNAWIHRGSIYHHRLEPRGHAFRYPVFFMSVDLDSFPEINQVTRLFGYNRKRLLNVRDGDYLDKTDEPLAVKIKRYMTHPDVVRITLVTVPRVMGYVFNPVSFYLGFDRTNQLIAAVAEVNNTFKERHVYVLDQPQADREGHIYFRTAKTFHVSPFNDRKGDYIFRIRSEAERLEVHIDIEREGKIVFRSGIAGRVAQPLSNWNILKTLVQFPFQNILTLPRIHFQAIHLYARKKMKYFPKPAPMNHMTIGIARPTWLEKIGRFLFSSLLKQVRAGSLLMRLPDGSETWYGVPDSEPTATLIVKDHTFFRRILLDGDIGLGEAYMYGQWETPDLTGFISFLIANRDALQNGEFSTSRFKWLTSRLCHLLRSNTRTMSRKNIGAHYDISNDFFSLFLDATMLYSAAVFSSPNDNLEQAQHNKMQVLIQKARIEPHHHVLEVGSGWGGLTIEIAKTVGCRVTGITISREQLTYARERVRREGLDHLVTFEFCDYRDLKGTFDRVVSVEMLEAVGHEHFGAYFSALDRVLKPDGVAVLQVITIPHQRYDAYRKSVDWIQKHIFPGGHLPSIEALNEAMSHNSKLLIDKVENIGTHYATTLKLWRNRLISQREKLSAMGYDEVFFRTWLYYFSYCEAAFATRTLDNHHLVLKR